MVVERRTKMSAVAEEEERCRCDTGRARLATEPTSQLRPWVVDDVFKSSFHPWSVNAKVDGSKMVTISHKPTSLRI